MSDATQQGKSGHAGEKRFRSIQEEGKRSVACWKGWGSRVDLLQGDHRCNSRQCDGAKRESEKGVGVEWGCKKSPDNDREQDRSRSGIGEREERAGKNGKKTVYPTRNYCQKMRAAQIGSDWSAVQALPSIVVKLVNDRKEEASGRRPQPTSVAGNHKGSFSGRSKRCGGNPPRWAEKEKV